jgi:hypothetical protein
MKTPVYRGAIAEESLDDRAALRFVRVVSSPGGGGSATLVVEGTRADIGALCVHLKPAGSHAQLWCGTRSLIAFRGRVFELDLRVRSGWDEAVRHAAMVGVPRESIAAPL